MKKRGRPVGTVRKDEWHKAVVITISIHKEILEKLDLKIKRVNKDLDKPLSRSSYIEELICEDLMHLA